MAVEGDLKVLYVDDEPDLIAVVVRSLELDRKITVRSVDRGAKALDLLAEGAWRPDVVLLDVTMPEMDGPTTLQRIGAMTDGMLPVIFFTARGRGAGFDALSKAGAIGVLGKPFDPMSLASDVRGLLASAADTRSTIL